MDIEKRQCRSMIGGEDARLEVRQEL